MWELIFLMVVMKIPIVYLCLVVWWAIKAEPKPLAGAPLPAAEPPVVPSPRDRRPVRPRPFRGGPHGSPRRRYARTARAAVTARER